VTWASEGINIWAKMGAMYIRNNVEVQVAESQNVGKILKMANSADPFPSWDEVAHSRGQYKNL
jgi:hypothetical protein